VTVSGDRNKHFRGGREEKKKEGMRNGEGKREGPIRKKKRLSLYHCSCMEEGGESFEGDSRE